MPGDLILAREAPVGNVAVVPPGLQVCLGQRTVLIRPDRKKADPTYLAYTLLGDQIQGQIRGLSTGATVGHLNVADIRAFPIPPLPSVPEQRRIAGIISAYDDLIENNTKRIKILEEMARSLCREWFVNFRFPGHEKTKLVNSKLGKVPEGWQMAELGAHVDMITGFPFKSDRYTDDPDHIKLLRGDNIAQGYLRWSGVKRWPQSDVDEYSRYALDPGDVVLAMDRPWIDAGLKWASVGKADVPALLVQRVARLRGSNGLHTTLVRHIIGSEAFCNYVKAITTGVNVPHISGPDIKRFPFCLAPPPIQQRAVEALSAMDDMIDNCTARNNILRATRDLLLPRLISGEIDVSSLPLERAAS